MEVVRRWIVGERAWADPALLPGTRAHLFCAMSMLACEPFRVTTRSCIIAMDGEINSRYGTVRRGASRHGVALRGTVRCSAVRRGAARRGAVRCATCVLMMISEGCEMRMLAPDADIAAWTTAGPLAAGTK